MQIVVISIVRNEADIIESFVRYSSRFADRMIIVDHSSEDETPAILRKLAKQGLPLEIRIDADFEQRQNTLMSGLLWELNGKADWVIPLDADEFLTSRAPPAAGLRKAIESLPADCVTLVPHRTYVPLPTDAEGEPDVTRRILHYRQPERPLFHKIILPGKYASADFQIAQGNHHLSCTDQTAPGPQHKITQTLSLAHFPLRSIEQAKRKAMQGWARNISRTDYKPGEGRQWKLLLDRFDRVPGISKVELQRFAMSYPDIHLEPDGISLALEPVATD